MLRAIIRQRTQDGCNGLKTSELGTVDFDAPELERVLSGGGQSEDSYDHRQVIEVIVVPQPASNEQEHSDE